MFVEEEHNYLAHFFIIITIITIIIIRPPPSYLNHQVTIIIVWRAANILPAFPSHFFRFFVLGEGLCRWGPHPSSALKVVFW